MQLELNNDDVQAMVRTIVQATMAELGWPPGRLALDEAEAAAACGVQRHVLRDLRLQGLIGHSKVGRKVVYRPCDLQDFLASGAQPARSATR